MTCLRIQGGTICVSDGGYKIRVGVRWWPFEWHNYFGPAAIHKRTGDIIASPKAFLRAAGLWAEQGKRIDADGWCVWDEEPEPQLVQLVGRHYAEVPSGETPESVREKWLAKLGSSEAGKEKAT